MPRFSPQTPYIPAHFGDFSELLRLPGDFPFFMNHMAVQPDMSAHHHECLEIAILLKGSGVHRTTTGEAACRAGQVFVIPPGVWHAYANCRNLELYNCLLSRVLLDGPLAWAAEDVALGPLLQPAPWQSGSQVLTWQLPQSRLPEARRLLSALLRTYKLKDAKRLGKLISQLLLLLDFLALESFTTHIPVAPAAVHSAVRRAAEMLRTDLARAWSLPELAGELRIHPSYLVRLFRQETGCAPMKFLAQERAHKAAQLLMTSKLPISKIGARVGWDEPKQFARSFRQQYGESASGFRRRMRG